MVFGVILGGLIMIGVMVFGLTRMGGEQEQAKIPNEKLVGGAGWITGGEDYRVTVVEFADLQCSACKQAEPVTEKLRQMEGVRYVFRYLPLMTIHKNAWVAAKAVEAARRMNKGWEMMGLLYEKQEEWAESGDFDKKVMVYAEELGLGRREFGAFYDEKNIEEQIIKDNALASELRVGGTPTFFVDGEQVATNFVLTRVKEILESN